MSSLLSAGAARFFLVCAALLAVLALPRVAWAQAPQGWARGMAIYVDGAGADRARRELTQAIPNSIPIIRNARIRKPRRPAFGVVLAQPARRKAWLRQVARAANEAGADGAVIVYLGPRGRTKHEERLLIVHGGKPDLLLEQRIFVKAETTEEREQRWRGVLESTIAEQDAASAGTAADPRFAGRDENPYFLGAKKPAPRKPETPAAPKPDPTRSASPTAKPEPKPEPRPAPKSSEPKAEPRKVEPPPPAPAPAAKADEKPRAQPAPKRKRVSSRARRPRARGGRDALNWLNLAVGVEWGARFFKHSEPATRSERSYTVRGMASGVAQLRVYPFVASEEVIWQYFSIDAEYATTVGLTSAIAKPEENEDPTVDTRWYRFGGGFSTRVPLSYGVEDWGLLMSLGYGRWTFAFDAPSETGRVPLARYDMLKPGVGVQVRGADVSVGSQVRYIHLLSVARLGQRKPQGWQAGFEMDLRATVRTGRHFHLGARASYTRFFFELAPIPARKDSPGSATDDYAQAGLFGEFVF
ncbi:MAG TPA: hypothetical protein VI072_05530 [Polyangiaceae bacterium]